MNHNTHDTIIDFTPAAKRSNMTLWLAVILGFGLSWAVMYFSWTQTQNRINAIQPSTLSPSDKIIQDLSQRIEDLERGVLSLSYVIDDLKIKQARNGAPKGATVLPAELPDSHVIQTPLITSIVTKGEFDQLSDQLEVMQKELATLRAVKHELAQATAHISHTKHNSFGPLVMALNSVERQVQQGLPFDKELALVELQSRNDTVIAAHLLTLKAHAGQGVSTYGALQDSFSQHAAKILQAEGHVEDAGLWQRMQKQLANLIVVRRIDSTEGNSTDAILARAEQALGRYQLAEALLSLEDLDAPSKQVLSSWLEDAGSRVAVDYAIDGILQRLTQQSSSTAQPPPAPSGKTPPVPQP